jgi:hypothetical protein
MKMRMILLVMVCMVAGGGLEARAGLIGFFSTPEEKAAKEAAKEIEKAEKEKAKGKAAKEKAAKEAAKDAEKAKKKAAKEAAEKEEEAVKKAAKEADAKDKVAKEAAEDAEKAKKKDAKDAAEKEEEAMKKAAKETKAKEKAAKEAADDAEKAKKKAAKEAAKKEEEAMKKAAKETKAKEKAAKKEAARKKAESEGREYAAHPLVAEETGWSALQLGWHAPAQTVRKEIPVYGLKLNLIQSENNVVRGADLGFISDIGEMKGVQVNFINSVSTSFHGIQLGLSNSLDASATGEEEQASMLGKSRGLHLGIVLNHSEAMDQIGAELAFIANIHGHDNVFKGLRVACINRSFGEVSGMELGILNWDENFNRGLQIGLVNYAVNLRGLQLGLLNITEEEGIKVLPIVNGRF